jgi:hypothetical protein
MAELTHEQLWHICQRKPGDYEPYGKRNRLMAGQIGGDCSGGGKWYHTLIGLIGASAAIRRVIVQGCSLLDIRGVRNLSASDL